MAVSPQPAFFPDDPGPRLARLEALVEGYQRLAQVFHHVLSEQSLDAVLDRVADTLADLVPHDSLTIYGVDERRRQLVPVLARDKYAEEILATKHAFGEGITGWAVENRRAVLANEAHRDPRVKVIPGTPADDPEALICVPLIARGSLKGALNVYRNGEGNFFEEEEFELAKWFGDAAALALDNAQIRARLEHLAQTDSLTSLFNHRTFHERLRAELSRAARAGDTLALMMIDIDDFKRVNDVYGHAEGDRVLVSLADVLRATIRASDIVCRVGGEEFAVVLPSSDEHDALGLARRLRAKLEARPDEAMGEITLSVGIALGPKHAMNARELIACAEAAMMTAKVHGKDRVVVFDDAGRERPDEPDTTRDVRSIAHLKMLQSLARRLNRLNDVRAIGESIVDELRMLIDYHNCVVYLTDDEELRPIAVRGTFEQDCEPDFLQLHIGEGVTGRVAETGKPVMVPSALECEYSVQIPGTNPIDESIVAVPLRYGPRVVGVIYLSKLGIGQFDDDDLRLLEVLAGHASVALENARLYESLRHEAENAKAWLEFADAVSEGTSVDSIAEEAARSIARLLETDRCSLWLEDTAAGNYRCAAHHGYLGDAEAERVLTLRPGRAGLKPILDGRKTPFVLAGDEVKRHFFPREHEDLPVPPCAIAPLHPGFGVRGWIGVRSPDGSLSHFTDERLRLLEGLSFRASVAIQKALLFSSQQESADVASALLEFSRQLAAARGRRETLERIVELVGKMFSSDRAALWIELAQEQDFRLEAHWRADGATPIDAVGSVFDFGDARRLLTRSDPFVLDAQPELAGLPRWEVPFAIAPLALGDRLGCLAVTAPAEGFADRRLRLLAGIANQASLALAATV
jgi:diguanylate cyclase (GGDEF)-like protein